MQHYFFVVEGPHDVAAIGRILKMHGLKEVTDLDKLSTAWERLIPDTYPIQGNKLDRISPIPTFFQNEERSVAIKVAGGICNESRHFHLSKQL